MNSGADLSIVVLCYGAGESLVQFAEEIKQVGILIADKIEIILVANYWPKRLDPTQRIVRAIAKADPSYVVIAKPKEGMMGWDMLEGMKRATGKYICVIDGDGQFPLDSIAQCYDLITSETCDLVKTFRARREDGPVRIGISKVYNLIFSVMFPGLGSKDVNSKPKIITQEAFRKMDLRSTDWFIDAEIMLNIRDRGMRFMEIPISFLENRERKSFVGIRAILEFVVNMIKYRFRGIG